MAVHQPQYFPYPGFFHKLSLVDAFVIMDDVQYDKRFTNRNRILDPHGPLWLTVPIDKSQRFLPNMDIDINNSIDWRADHWKKISFCYSNAPCFAIYRDAIRDIFAQRWSRLFDLDHATLKACMGWLGLDIPIIRESSLGVRTEGTERIVEVCKAVGADAYVSGIGGRAYMDEELFRRKGVKLEYQQYSPAPYPQRFTSEFVPNLSVLDMLANVGVRSREVVDAGSVVPLQRGA